mmetsp:Transcript_7814/g.22886  ORF Transcript_7814/g.22886 Transcript_7814/m.22886 type:complete len:315 (-) Transcript_7814:1920-2864(-)
MPWYCTSAAWNSACERCILASCSSPCTRASRVSSEANVSSAPRTSASHSSRCAAGIRFCTAASAAGLRYGLPHALRHSPNQPTSWPRLPSTPACLTHASSSLCRPSHTFSLFASRSASALPCALAALFDASLASFDSARMFLPAAVIVATSPFRSTDACSDAQTVRSLSLATRALACSCLALFRAAMPRCLTAWLQYPPRPYADLSSCRAASSSLSERLYRAAAAASSAEMSSSGSARLCTFLLPLSARLMLFSPSTPAALLSISSRRRLRLSLRAPPSALRPTSPKLLPETSSRVSELDFGSANRKSDSSCTP